MFRSLFDIVERQRDLTEEERIALLEQWKATGAKPEITGWWNKTLYVDATNGDDNNDGSSSAPFKTIEKAINSVPVGGYAWITLLSDVSLLNSVYVNNKALVIVLNSHSFSLTVDSQSLLRKFLSENFCAIRFVGSGKLVLPARASDTSQINNHPALLFNGYSGHGFKSLSLTYGVEVVVNDTAYKLIELNNNSTCSFVVDNTSTITDNTGSNLTWADLVTGIVKDANNVPRNIISNIVL